MPSFVRIDFSDKLACQSGSKLGTLYPRDLFSARDVLSLDDQESLTFSFSRVSTFGLTRQIVPALVGRTIATVVWDDGSFDERRVALIEDGRGVGGLVSVTANPLILDLAEGADSSTGKGLVSQASGCFRVMSFGVLGMTATQIWDTYIIPSCPSWVSRGTIDPTVVIPQLSWDRLTPQALALLVRDTLRKMNIPCELRLRRNGTTDYKLDLVTQVGSSATVPIFHPRTTLQSLKRRVDTNDQATRLFVTGEADPSSLAGIPGRARWSITNIASLTLTLADPNGGAGPIGMTNQWAGAWLVRVLTGRSFPIQSSNSANQTVTLLAVSTMTTGEVVEFRLTEPGTNAREIATPIPRFAVSSIGGSLEYLALSSNPITVDGEYTDWYARVWTASTAGSVVKDIRITGSTASTDRVACTPGAASGVTTSHFVEIIQLDGAGEIPSYLEHATFIQASPTGYGVKVGDLAINSAFGVTNLIKNSWMRNWSNPSNPPDGWYLLQGAFPGPLSRNSNPDFTIYGGFSYSVDFKDNFVITPRFDVVLAPGNTRVSARARVWFTAFGSNHVFSLSIYALQADGVTIGAELAAVRVVPVSFSGATSNARVAVGAWVVLEAAGFDLAFDQAPYGMVCVLSDVLAGAGQAVAYIDTVEVYGFATNPTGVYEYGDATVLHQAGNRHLISNGSPPISYELTVLDLERDNPPDWPEKALTLGGSVRAFDADFGVDVTVRLLRLERDLLRPKNSIVGLASLPTLFTQVVQAQ